MNDDFTVWFNGKNLVTVEWVERQIDEALYAGRSIEAAAMIDWMHAQWAKFWEKDGRHITGPYCRIGLSKGFCRLRAKAAVEDSTQGDQPPTPEAAS